MKKIKALWHGIRAVFTAVVDWVATLFCMNDETKHSRVTRKIVSTAFAVVVALWAVTLVIRFAQNVCWRFDLFDKRNDEFYGAYLSDVLSDNVRFYKRGYDDYGFVADSNKKILLKNIYWISKPLEGDSLVCYCDGDKRGYFHMRDGRVVVKPIYEHAWIFSEGLAAVEVNKRVKFINTEGKVVIDRGFVYNIADDGYVFHQGHCAVNDSTGKHMGLIDHDGNWVLPPVYYNISQQDTFWLLTMNNQQAVLTFGMDTVMPMSDASFVIDDTVIFATFADHSQNQYDLRGNLLVASQIRNVATMMFETRDVMYPVNKDGNECSDEYYSYGNPAQRMAVATCLCYEAESGWFGLMSPDGRMITPPTYSSIIAVDKDLYLCETTYGRGVLLNSKGQRVE